jgi:hypothetical protein
MPKRTDREADYMCFSPLGRKTSELEGGVLVGSFPGIYVIGNKVKSTKVARFNLAAEFRKKTSEEIIYFLLCFEKR